MQHNPTDAYRRIDILGKSPLELVIEVYDGAITAYNTAKQLYQEEDFRRGYEQLEKAKRFVTHLYTTLDPERGGEIADNLAKLYAFILSQTDLAEATKDCDIIENNIRLLKNLREGWAGIRQTAKEEKSHLTAEADKVAEVVSEGLSISG